MSFMQIQNIELVLKIDELNVSVVRINTDKMTDEQIEQIRTHLPDFVIDLSQKMVQNLLARGFKSKNIGTFTNSNI